MSTDLAIEDVLDVEYPAAPTWSADGRFVAARVYEDDGHALLVAASGTEPRPGSESEFDSEPEAEPGARAGAGPGSEPRRLAPGEGHVAAVEWAPEPTPARLALVTDEDELFLVDAARGTTERLTDAAAADDLAWTADGRHLAFYREDRPCVVDLDGATTHFDTPERGPFLGEDRMLAWGPEDRRLAYRFVERDTTQVGVVDVTDGDLAWRTRESAFAARNPAWLGDGRLLLDRVGEDGTVREFVAVDVADGSRTVLFREEDREDGVASRGAPVVSPEGDRVAAALPLDGWEHVYVFDAGTGDRTQLTAGSFEDKGVADSRPRWLDDDTLVFASNRRDSGRRDVFAVRPARVDADPEVHPLVTGAGTSVHPRPSPNGERVAFVHADATVSPELRVATLADAPDEAGADSPEETDADSLAGTGADTLAGTDADDARRVTRSTVADWPVDPVAPEHVTYESVGGREIHAYLLDPRETGAVADDAADLPAVVWVHGGPMRQMRDGWHPSRSYGLAYTVHQYLATRGYVGLFVNYRGGIGYGREFRQSLAGVRGRDEMEDVARGAEFLRDRAYVGDRVGIWGLSYGGYAALQLLGTHPDAFDVGVNLAGLADLELYRDWAEETKYPAVAASTAVRLGGEPWEVPGEWAAASPETHMDEYEAPLYSFHGTGDRYVNVDQLDRVVDRVLELDLDADWEYYPGENHVFSERATWERALERIEDAFDDHLQ